MVKGVQMSNSGEPERILIVLLGALGDVARGSTIIPPLRRRFPNAEISWLVETKSAAFVRLNERVDTVYEFVRSRWWEGAELVGRLRQSRFDLVLDLQRHAKSGLFSYLTGAPRRIGVNRKNAKEGNWLFNTHHCEYVPDTESKMELYRSFLTALGIEEGLDHSGGFRREQFLPLIPEPFLQLPGRRVGVVLGSTWQTKDLPKQGYQQLVGGLLKETDFSIVLLGDKSQAALGNELVAHAAGGARLLNLAGMTNLGQLMGVLAASSVVIGPDSGPGHLSSLVGTPSVTVFGPTDPKRVVPFGSEAFAIVPSVGCAPCWRRTCPGLNTICMRLHAPSEMISQVVGAASAHQLQA